MKDKQRQDIALKIESAITNIFIEQENSEQKVEIVDIVVSGKKEVTITIYLYSVKGLDAEELSLYHKKIYTVLEQMQEFSSGFALEVSTPGIFRKIKYIREFDIFLERELKITTQDKDTIIGICQGVKEDCLSIMLENDKVITIPLDKIKSAYLNG